MILDYIKTGDTVYISGLYGNKNSVLNNKHGVVKNMFSISNNEITNNIAEVKIKNKTFLVNFEYLFKINPNFNDRDVQNLIFEENVFDFYIKKHKLVSNNIIIDENGQVLSLSSDINNKKFVFLYSGIN